MMGVIETGTGVVGREHELATLRSFIVDTDTPAAVVIDGDAGIGKTTVWDAGIEAAEAAGHRVLRCRPVLSEAQLSFAAVGDLLDEVLEDALPALPAPQQHALRVALLIDEPDGPAPDVRAIAGAVLGVLRHLCADRPVLLAVDDVQWLDDPSRTVLEFVIRRLREEPIRLLVARRGVGADLPLGLARALAPSALEHITLAPLSLGALHRLLQTRLGAAFPRPVLRRLYATSGGNPFYTLELGRALERHRGTLGPEEPLPVPTTLQELVQDRVNAQPERVRVLLELVAALYDRHLAAVVELARADGLDGAIDEAMAAGVLAVDGGRLEFSHPLLASVVYGAMGPERRREVHGHLVHHDARNEAGTVHLALATGLPDAQVAADLDRSAARARARGAAASAARYAEKAAELTPPDDVDTAARRLIAAAEHHSVAGDPAHATALLRGVVARLPTGTRRGEALSLLAWVAPDGLDAAVRLGGDALAEATGDPRLEATTRLRLGVIEEIRGDLDASMEHRQRAAVLAEQTDDPALRARALAALGYAITVRDSVVVEASRQAVEIERSLDEFLGQYAPSISLGLVLKYTDAFDEARDVLEGALAAAIEAGHEDAHCTCLFHLADLERRAGHWEPARRFSDATRELNAQAGTEQEYASCLVIGAMLDAGTGRIEEARADAQAGLAAAERIGDETFAIHHRGVLGFIELSLGNPEAAEAWLARGTDRLIEQGAGEVSIYPAFQFDVDAAIEVGDVRRAERLVAHLERLATTTGRSWTRATAHRGRGLIHAAHGDLERARESLERSVAAHEERPQPLELGRSLLALGKLERRAKRKRASRDALERAAAVFEALPAPLWKAKVDDELARLGMRSAPGGLTETEARIAEMAASGMTNPEIAAAAFVSRKTVEANLSKVYRKLGVRSRVELARRLSSADL